MVEVVLAALYLRGFGAGCPKRRWPLVVGALRVAGNALERHGPSEVLRRAGLPEEAYGVAETAILAAAEKLVETGRVKTVVSEGYPARWREILGAAAPPALWAGGARLSSGVGFIGVVGSREPSDELAPVVREVVAQIGGLGYAVISGGARGVDRWAASGAVTLRVPVLELLPVGFSVQGGRRESPSEGSGHGWLSLNPPSAPVTTAALMERNVLIYAASEAAVVFRPRFRVGGTWHGASEALRRGLCRLLVYRPASAEMGFSGGDSQSAQLDLASRALIALGGLGFSSSEEFPSVLRGVRRQPVLPHAESW